MERKKKNGWRRWRRGKDKTQFIQKQMDNNSYLFRMVHINNITHILNHGITHAESDYANPNYSPIGNGAIIEKRRKIFDPIHNKPLSDYIPFYFGPRMPMLYVIQKGYGVPALNPSNIVYLVSNIQKILDAQLSFVFTNGHAVSEVSEFFGEDDIPNINDILDQNAIKTSYWNDPNDLDLKRRKEAEFLVLNDIPINLILGYIVYDEQAKAQLIDQNIPEQKVHISAERYF